MSIASVSLLFEYTSMSMKGGRDVATVRERLSWLLLKVRQDETAPSGALDDTRRLFTAVLEGRFTCEAVRGGTRASRNARAMYLRRMFAGLVVEGDAPPPLDGDAGPLVLDWSRLTELS